MVQLSQNVACNRLHSPEERAARWLLMTADRVGAERFPLTQEFLAQMLGVRRATVSITAGLLHNAGLISYTRGVITVDDRAGLEDAACDCYGIVRDEFQELAKPA
jgi:CRP-like cAMP-binding protein